MKKFLARLSLLGLFAGIAAGSYTVPAAASDSASRYTGPTTSSNDVIIIIEIGEDYYYYYVEYYGRLQDAASTSGLTDAAFDQ
jgi:hypothetical protein